MRIESDIIEAEPTRRVVLEMTVTEAQALRAWLARVCVWTEEEDATVAAALPRIHEALGGWGWR